MTRCEHCGHLDAEAPAKCPACGAARTLLPVEEEAPPARSLAVDVNALSSRRSRRIATGYKPWDEVLSGGVVLGSSILLYGPDGSRKSTWAGAIADRVADGCRGRALYLSAEMPAYQVAEACRRVRSPLVCLSIVGSENDASNLELCLTELERLRPRVVVYDSVQHFEGGGAIAGSNLAIKYAVRSARRAASRFGHLAILLSQVNRAGLPSGPHRAMHDCDVVARLEKGPPGKVVVTKNRFSDRPCPVEATLP